MTRPAAVFGVPLYNESVHLPEALESLLGQTRSDLAIVLVDDSTTPEPAAIVEQYARHDSRLSYFRNPVRLGMVANWRRAFDVARERFPDTPCFAWGSDHDVWHPHWLAAMLGTLETHPGVVAAYPLVVDIFHSPVGERRPEAHPAPDTTGLLDPAARFRRVCLSTVAGNAVYALFRTWALARAGVFRSVMLPDRLLLAEMSLYGQFEQVPEYLWMRRRVAEFTMARQRGALFAGRRPASIILPWPLVHTAILTNELVLHGRGGPEVRRRDGFGVAGRYLVYSLVRQARRLRRLLRAWASRRRAGLGRLVRRRG